MTTTVMVDYNHIFPPTGTAQGDQVVEISNTSWRNWISWGQVVSSGYETHGIGWVTGWVNPLATKTNYAPNSLSDPDVDKGVTIADFSSDILNNPRPQGSAWDIGAYEHVQGKDTAAPAAPTGLAVY